jgi:dipeptidyl aminopeptidase/acylaminoacyl peptidase
VTRRALLVTALAVAAAGCGGRGAVKGPQLVYAVPTSFGGSHSWIWRARTDGTQRVRLTEGRDPVLAPNGRLIVFLRPAHSPAGTELYVVSVSGGEPRLLRRFVGERAFVSELVWSPSSRQIAVAEGASLVLVDVDSGRARRFAGTLRPRVVGVEHPSFSPDGRRIVFERYDQTGGDLVVFDTRTGRTRRLTRDHRSFMPLWGPRGIAFNRGGFVRGGDVWLLDPRGRKLRRLTHGGDGIYPAAWSAGGKRLLAANPAVHNGRLWAVDLRSGRARDLTGWVGDLFPQGLSRDGRTILAAIGCGGLLSPFGVVETLPFAGGKPNVIVKGPCRASWNE